MVKNRDKTEFERAIDRLEWDVTTAIDDVRSEFVAEPISNRWIDGLLHEAEGILLDGDNPTKFLMQELRRWK